MNEFQKKEGDKYYSKYFIPFFRPLDYIFRTPYSKIQYDIFLQGENAYNQKAKNFKKIEPSVKKIIESQELAMLSGTIKSHLE